MFQSTRAVKNLMFISILLFMTFRSTSGACSSYRCKSSEDTESRPIADEILVNPKFRAAFESEPQKTSQNEIDMSPQLESEVKPRLGTSFEEDVMIAVPVYELEDFEYKLN